VLSAPEELGSHTFFERLGFLFRHVTLDYLIHQDIPLQPIAFPIVPDLVPPRYQLLEMKQNQREDAITIASMEVTEVHFSAGLIAVEIHFTSLPAAPDDHVRNAVQAVRVDEEFETGLLMHERVPRQVFGV
jgi:hypothetical protein